VSTHHVALLAALNLADELARTKEALLAAQNRAETEVRAEKVQLDDIRQTLTQKAQSTLRDVEAALAFLPAEWKGQEG
jgi:cell division protein ZapA (FtsZ GTPase activity inhibitor)